MPRTSVGERRRIRFEFRTLGVAFSSVVFFGSALYIVGLSAMLSSTPISINPDFKMPYEAAFLFFCGVALFASALYNAKSLRQNGH